MQTEHTVQGGGGIRIHVLETGKPEGPPVLFLHTYSHCRLSWIKQLESDLGDDFRLVAMDLRGHGLSEKGPAIYSNAKLWAEDVHAVIHTVGLHRPFLVAHAWAGTVVCDYLRYYGDQHIRGFEFAGAMSKQGSPEALSVISDEALALVPGLFSNHIDESSRSLAEYARLCGGEDLSEADFYFWFGFMTMTPPYVREAMFHRVFDNDDLFSQVKVPVLISHGARDGMVFLAAAEHHARLIPGAKLSVYEEGGHSLHWQDPERFNHELRAFIQAI